MHHNHLNQRLSGSQPGVPTWEISRGTPDFHQLIWFTLWKCLFKAHYGVREQKKVGNCWLKLCNNIGIGQLRLSCVRKSVSDWKSYLWKSISDISFLRNDLSITHKIALSDRALALFIYLLLLVNNFRRSFSFNFEQSEQDLCSLAYCHKLGKFGLFFTYLSGIMGYGRARVSSLWGTQLACMEQEGTRHWWIRLFKVLMCNYKYCLEFYHVL